MVDLTKNKVSNARDGNAEALGQTIDSRDGTPYKVYESTLTTNTELDIFTDLGREGSAGYLLNDDDTDALAVQFSRDGTTYGESITVKALEQFDFNTWEVFRKIKLIHSSDAPYRIVVR